MADLFYLTSESGDLLYDDRVVVFRSQEEAEAFCEGKEEVSWRVAKLEGQFDEVTDVMIESVPGLETSSDTELLPPLLPCPFCGGHVSLTKTPTGTSVGHETDFDCFLLDGGANKAELVAKWNNRVPQEKLKKDIFGRVDEILTGKRN